jgi:hypothetical protein
MKRLTFLVVIVALLLVGSVMPVSAKRADQPLVPPVEQPEGTVRLTGEFFSWPLPVYDLYRIGILTVDVDYYCMLEGVYYKTQLGPVNVYREGGHFYYWLDVLPDDPNTEELEGPSSLGEGANFAYKWMPKHTASQELGTPARDRTLKYTPDPDPQGALPRVVTQDLTIRFDVF